MRSRRGVDVTGVLPMIWQKARNTHKQLAPHTRNWVSVEDQVSESIVLTLGKAAKGFNRKKKAKFSTYLFKALDNNNINTLVFYSAKERDERRTMSYDSDSVRRDGTLYPIDFYVQRTKKVDSPEEQVIKKVDAERAFLTTYHQATPLLRRYLIRWLLQPKTTKFKDGSAFRNARKEFRKLCWYNNLTLECCQTITEHNQLRTELCYKLVFELGYRTIRKENRPHDLKHSEEYVLVPLALRFVQANGGPQKMFGKRFNA